MDRNIGARIQMAVNDLCAGNKSEFCRRIGRPVEAIKDIIGGKQSQPGYNLIYDILSSDLGISPNWLILGVGDMTYTPTPSPSPSVQIGTIQTVNIGNWGELVKLLKDKVQ